MTSPSGNAGFLERFPSFRRLARLGRGRIPFVAQTAGTDCGAACLAMVLGHFGKHAPIDQVREAVGAGRDGIDALAIVRAARQFGLRVQSVGVDLDSLRFMDPGAILYWNFSHFVVFERRSRRGYHIVDPGLGPRLVPPREFGRAFTGVALLMEPTDDFERSGAPRTGLSRHLAALRRQRQVLAKVLGTSAVIQLLALSGAILTTAVVDRVLPSGDWDLLGGLAIAAAVLLGLQFSAEWVRARLSLHLRTHLDIELTTSFVDHLFRLPFPFFQSRPAGDLALRLNSNAVVREFLTAGAISSVLDGALVNGYLVVLWLVSVPLGLLVTAVTVIQVGILLAFRGRLREATSESLEAEANRANHEVEMLTGVETLKSMGLEDLALDRWSGLLTESHNLSLRRGRLDGTFTSLNSALRHGSAALVLLYGARLVLDGQLSLGTALGAGVVAGGLLGPLGALVQTVTQLGIMRSYLDRIDDVMAAEREPAERTGPRRLEGEVELERVSFSYSGVGQLVVRDVSMRVERGSYLCVVGRSGSGKSTLAKLLLGLYRPTSGKVLFDGVDLQALSPRSLRQEIGVVPQDARLFGVSIRENIAMGRPGARLAEVVEAAMAAGLHEEIRGMPMGYETVLIGGGQTLSGGQRQRVALARALIRRPRILLLDEATSALDAQSERRILDALADLACTRITIAHRLSTALDADQIAVMEAGSLVEVGSHVELMARGGAYAALVARQVNQAAAAKLEAIP